MNREVCGALSLVFLARTHNAVNPEFDDREIMASITMMNKMQPAFSSKPCEAVQVRIDQMIMFVQIKVPTKCREYANEVSDHHQRAAGQALLAGLHEVLGPFVPQGQAAR